MSSSDCDSVIKRGGRWVPISPGETLNEGVVVTESTVGEWGCLKGNYPSNTRSKSILVWGWCPQTGTR